MDSSLESLVAPPGKNSVEHARTPASGFQTLLVRTPEELAMHAVAWQDLAENAVQPNVFYEPWTLMPAIRFFGAGRDLEFLLLFGPGQKGAARLCGLFPFERKKYFRGLPIPHLRLWAHKQCFLCTPLIRKGVVEESLDALFDWMEVDCKARLLVWGHINGEGPFYGALWAALQRRKGLTITEDFFERAVFRRMESDQAHLEAVISGKHRKDFRRLERRLGEHGAYSYEVLTRDGPLDRWIDEFLEVEASGWKGREQSALKCHEGTESFFRTLLKEAFQRGRLLMIASRIEGKPLAFCVDILSGNAGVSFKIAFDEAYSQYSPGILLELEHIRRLYQSPIQWMDSCAIPRHAMINRLWPGKLKIANVSIAFRLVPEGLTVKTIQSLKRLRDRLVRSTAKPRKRRAMDPILEINEADFKASYDGKPFLIKHRLENHPLFELSRLVELSRMLPENKVEYNAGNVPISLDPKQTPRTGLSIEDTIRRIEEHQSWMVLKNVELVPQYKDLLDACLDEVKTHSEAVTPGMRNREAFIFISSAGSITPYHMDPEHNFLLQIRGDKVVTLFDRTDRSVLSEEHLERFYMGEHRNMEFKEEYRKAATEWPMRPGDGLHFPVTAPHWVKVGSSYSISFSITYASKDSIRREQVYFINAQLRKRRLKPTPYGKSPLKDRVKYSGFQILRRIRRFARRKKQGAGAGGRTYQ